MLSESNQQVSDEDGHKDGEKSLISNLDGSYNVPDNAQTDNSFISKILAGENPPMIINSEEFENLPNNCRSSLLECYGQFLMNNATETKKRKKSFALLKALENISITTSNHDNVLQVFSILMELLSLNSTTIYQIESLKLIRNMIQSSKLNLTPSMLNQNCTQLKKSIDLGLSKFNLNLVDSCLEVLNELIAENRQYITDREDLVDTFMHLWRLFKNGSLNTSVASSFIPILLFMDLELTQDQLSLYGIKKNCEILEVISAHLTGIDSELKESIIRAIRKFLPYSILREGKLTMAPNVYSRMIGIPISRIAIQEMDQEILTLVFRFWNDILAIPIKNCNLIMDVLKIMQESGSFSVINSVIKDANVLPSIKCLAYENLKAFRKATDWSKLEFDELKQAFLAFKKPSLQVTVNCEMPVQTCYYGREKVLDEIFGDHTLPPTQDLIENLISRENDKKNLIQEDDFKDIPIDELIDFLINFSLAEDDIVNDSRRIETLSDVIFEDCYDRTILADCF